LACIQQQSSLTALTAAAARTAHLIVDGEPHIFADTLAAGILGEQAEELLRYHRVSGDHILRGARTQVVVRSRYTEDRLAEAMKNGMAQYVLLGAGLDSFGYRTESAVRVFEVDHPPPRNGKKRTWKRPGSPFPAPFPSSPRTSKPIRSGTGSPRPDSTQPGRRS
jgi:methyltransferase (TIGR00027 family)